MKKQVLIITMLALILCLSHFHVKNAPAQTGTITLSVTPSEYYASRIGEEFSINITISNVEEEQRLVGLNFRVSYNDSLLEVINVAEGPFLRQFNQTPTEPYTFFIYYIDPASSFPNGTIVPPSVVIGLMLMPNGTGQWPGPFPEGEGTLATITFRAINQSAEPQGPLSCNFHIFDVTIIDDAGNDLPYTVEDGYYEIPQLSFEYTYETPYCVRFTASVKIKAEWAEWYYWQFGDGTELNTTEQTIIHQFMNPGVYNVTLTVHYANSTEQPTAWRLIGVGYVEVRIETGSIFFKGETCEFNILTTFVGVPVNVSEISAELYFNGALYENLTEKIEAVTTGYYRISYVIPDSAENGTYTLIVKANYHGAFGADIKSFLISETFSDMHDAISDLKDYLINNITTEIGIIKGNLSDLTDRLNEVKNDLIQELNNLAEELNDAEASLSDLNRQLAANTTQTMNNKFDAIEEGQNSILTTFYLTSAVELGLLVIVAAVSIYLARKK